MLRQIIWLHKTTTDEQWISHQSHWFRNNYLFNMIPLDISKVYNWVQLNHNVHIDIF